MNAYLKVVLCVIVGAVIWLVGFEWLHLFTEVFGVVLIIVVTVVIFVLDLVDWSFFVRDRRILSVEEWKPKAIADLIANCPEDFSDRVVADEANEAHLVPVWGFEAEILQDVPIGILWVFNKLGLKNKRCAFGEVYDDSKNVLISPLESLDWHRHSNNCHSKREVGLLYLRARDKNPKSLFKKKEELDMEVSE